MTCWGVGVRAGVLSRKWLAGSWVVAALGAALLLALAPVSGGHGKELRPARPVGQVYLFRGIFGIDGGISILRDELLRRGIPAVAYNPGEWSGLTGAIANARMAQGAPVVLIGFSLGGQDAVDLTYALGQAGVPVDLLVTLDSPDPLPVPANVRQALNLYQTTAGAWRGRPLAAAASFQGQLVNMSLDSVPGIEHHDFVNRTQVITPVLRQVLQALRRGP
jgi:hypothetical protein